MQTTKLPPILESVMTNKTTILTMTLLAGMLAIVPISASADIDDNLIVYFGFDGNTNDYSGNSNNGTVTGTEKYSSGPMSTAFNFDGSSSITLDNEPNYDFTHIDPFSVCAWKQNDDTTPNNLILSKRNTAGLDGWAFTDVGKIRFQVWDGAERFVQGTTILNDQLWHHICGTYDGGQNQNGMKVYVNGALDGTGTSNAITDFSNNQQLRIGASPNNALYWDGSIDDVRIYDVELNSTQIQSIYEESPFVLIEKNTAEIDDLYDFWTDLKDSIITWLAGRP